jgi:SAM-dependent methyltransferase
MGWSDLAMANEPPWPCLCSGSTGLENQVDTTCVANHFPAECEVRYFDVMSVDEARSRFPEMDPDCFVLPDYHGDLDRGGLTPFENRSCSFVILNHVLEHVANSIKVLREVYRLFCENGFLVISVPDKNYTYDRTRDLPTWKNLFREYIEEVNEVLDEQYMDFLTKVAPEISEDPDRDISHDLRRVRGRLVNGNLQGISDTRFQAASCSGSLLPRIVGFRKRD